MIAVKERTWSAPATAGANAHSSAQSSPAPSIDRDSAVSTCAPRSRGCCTSAGPTNPCDNSRERLITSIAADTDPKSAGVSNRARTASTPTVTRPWTPAPDDIHSQPENARSVRLGGRAGGGGGGSGACNGSMTGPAARIGKGLASDGVKLPGVRAGQQGKLQDPVGPAVPPFAISAHGAERDRKSVV